MSKPKAPKAPDYGALANQQAQANQQAAEFNLASNRVNQVTPWGSSTWSYTPQGGAAPAQPGTGQPQITPQQGGPMTGVTGKELAANAGIGGGTNKGPLAGGMATGGGGGNPYGQWTQTVTLSPEQQALFDQQNQISKKYGDIAVGGLGRVEQQMGTEFDPSGLPKQYSMSEADLPTLRKDLPVGYLTNYDVPDYLKSSFAGGGAAGGGASSGQVGGGGASVRQVRDTFDTSGVRQLPGTIDDASRKRVEEALMGRVQGQYDEDERKLRARLLNSGIEVGTDAYNREMANYSQRLNDARMASVLAGGQEESRQVGLIKDLQAQEFGQALSKGQFGQTADVANAGNELTLRGHDLQRDLQSASLSNARATNLDNLKLAAWQTSLNAQNQGFNQGMATNQFYNTASNQEFGNKATLAGSTTGSRNAALAEALTLRQLPMNELNALRSGAQVQAPQFDQYYTTQTQPAPIFDAGVAQANYNMGMYGNQQGGWNAMLGGLANLGGTAMQVWGSDARLKSNLTSVGKHPTGVNRYAWTWADGTPGFGVLAQEVVEVLPQAVVERANGFLAVDYGMLGGV